MAKKKAKNTLSHKERAITLADKALQVGMRAVEAGELRDAWAAKGRAFTALCTVAIEDQASAAFSATWEAFGKLEIAIRRAKIEQEQSLSPVSLLERRGWITLAISEKRRPDGVYRLMYRFPRPIDLFVEGRLIKDLAPYYEPIKAAAIRNRGIDPDDAPISKWSNVMALWLVFVPEHERDHKADQEAA